MPETAVEMSKRSGPKERRSKSASEGKQVSGGRRYKQESVPKVRLLTMAHIDSRTRAAQRVRDVVRDIEGDLGGADFLTAGQHQLAQRAAMLGAIVEDCETHWAPGQPIDLGGYLSAVILLPGGEQFARWGWAKSRGGAACSPRGKSVA